MNRKPWIGVLVSIIGTIIFWTLIINLFTSCEAEPLDGYTGEPDKLVYKYDYKVTSYEWNETKIRLDIPSILKPYGYEDDDLNGVSPTIAIADFNLDGYLDFQTQYNVGKSDSVPVEYHFFIYNKDSDSYVKGHNFTFTQVPTLMGRRTVVGDFNNDKKPDVVRGAGAHGRSDGAYDQPNIMLSNETGYDLMKIEGSPMSNFHGLSSGDIDNDGDLDLFFVENDEFDGFALNNGDGTFVWNTIRERILNLGPYRYGMWTNEIYDINKDGYLDLIIAGGAYGQEKGLDGITVLYGDGTGFFDYEERVAVINQESNGEHDVAFGDIDNDGDLDIVAVGSVGLIGGIVTAYENTGDSFIFRRPWIANEYLPASWTNLTTLIVKDIDGDGLLDITEEETFIREIDEEREAFYFKWDGTKFTR